MNYRDPDRPSTWVRYKSGMCEGCNAGCCTMPVEVRAADLIKMGFLDEGDDSGSLKKAAKNLEKKGIVHSFRAATGIFILAQKSNNDCYFLDSKTRLCTIYENRPATCRNFPAVGSRPGFCPASKK